MSYGYLTLVLHAHMPYLRQAGRWPHGEEMLHEAIAETYIPLLNALYDLRAEGVPFRLTIGITPVLAEQLADADVLDAFETFLLEEIERAEEDVGRFQAAEQAGEPQAGHLSYLARFYGDWYDNVLQSFRERFGRNLVRPFRLLQDEGYIEIITGPATHGYLPLLARDSSIYGQLKIGVTTYFRHFGRLPRGIWLPECGYRPAYYVETEEGEYIRPGLEEFLAEFNLRYTFVDSHSIEGPPPTLETGEAQGLPYRSLPLRRWVARTEGDDRQVDGHSTFRPYYIHGSNVALYGRDGRTGKQVWSASDGYPGDYIYREFHRKDRRSGLQYWRITGEEVDLADKALYDPYDAFHRAREHAAHFVELVREHLRQYDGHHDGAEPPGIIVAAYDTELFGHWWFEGVVWLKEALLRLSRDPGMTLTTAGAYLQEYPPEESIAVPEGSWGQGGGHATWQNPATDWMWSLVHEAERRMERLVRRYPDAEGDRLEVLKQLARELLLLQSSDWFFLVGTQQAEQYAGERFQEHLARFNRLALLVEKERLDQEERLSLQEYCHLDNAFLNMDYRVFAARGGQANSDQG